MTPVTSSWLESTFAARYEARAEALARTPSEGLAVWIVVGGFDPASFVRESLGYLASLPATLLARWHAAFTRTVFLVGNPVKLAARHAFHRVSRDGAVAWTAPRITTPDDGLRRLLKVLPAEGPARLPARVAVDGDPGGDRVTITMATGGLRFAEYLVHLNHLLAESFAEGALDARASVAIDHVDAIDAVDERASHARVHRRNDGAPGLRLYGQLVRHR